MKRRGLFGSRYELRVVLVLFFVLSYWQSCWGVEKIAGDANRLPYYQIKLTSIFTGLHFTSAFLFEKPSIQSSEFCEFGIFQPLPSDSPKRLNPGKVFLQSLLLPGWGELHTGAKKRATGFLISEGLLWCTFAALQIYGYWRENDYKDFAAKHAGVQVAGKDKEYFTHLSFFDDIYEYNEEKRRLRSYDEVYPVDEEHFWRWDSQASRRHFSSIRLSSQRAYRNATLTVGVILFNHLLSAIDAIWTARGHNKKLQSSVNWHIESRVRYHSQNVPYFQVGLVRSF
ncbi:hypothetical protein DRQ12_00970 [candidate division KSB1 bacterium]|nr:MAG: hypothetical protein DRQ12_00970 [candidate division KSB1 bacterium]HDI51538.1 hypothetical protein [Bacteroidota bacterium]